MSIKCKLRPEHSFSFSQKKIRRTTKLRYISVLSLSSSRTAKEKRKGTKDDHKHTPATGVTTVNEALSKARECPECAQDPMIVALLDVTIDRIWKKIQTRKEYVMSRDEFSFFTYFQSRFEGLQITRDARKRYWDNMQLAV